jgi:hypothetical protein
MIIKDEQKIPYDDVGSTWTIELHQEPAAIKSEANTHTQITNKNKRQEHNN